MLDHQEHFIELLGLSPDYVGRIILNRLSENYYVELDIVHSESGKIYQHIESLWDQTNPEDALAFAVHRFKKFLDSKR